MKNACAATRMQLEIIIQSEVRKRKTDAVWYHLCVESKIWHNWTYLWNWQRADLWLPREKGQRAMDWELGFSRCKLLYITWINNNILLYSTGDYTQYPVVNHNRQEYEKEHIYTNHCHTLETLTTLQINYTSIRYILKNIAMGQWVQMGLEAGNSEC